MMVIKIVNIRPMVDMKENQEISGEPCTIRNLESPGVLSVSKLSMVPELLEVLKPVDKIGRKAWFSLSSC